MKYITSCILAAVMMGLLMIPPAPASAGVISISGYGCRFPDAAYDSTDGYYLVVWVDYRFSPARIYGRFVGSDGSVIGDILQISDGSTYALYPAVAYNSINNEFLVTWDDGRGETINGQRVNGSDGTLDGGNFIIGVTGGARSSVAWSSISNCYMVVYSNFSEVYGRRVSNEGVPLGAEINVSSDATFSAYPSVSYGSAGDQFLVTWDHSPDGNGYIRGRRLSAATGSPLGNYISVSSRGGEDRSAITYDSNNGRWFVQYQEQWNTGYSYDQYGQLINSDGTLNGGPVAIAHTTAFEGETLLGCDVCFAPQAGRFFSSFQLDDNMGGQECSDSGSVVDGQVVLATGVGGANANAADITHNRFLAVWESLHGSTYYIEGAIHAAVVHPVTNLSVTSSSNRIDLVWTNPSDRHFSGTIIRYKTTSYPSGPSDGILLVDKPGTAGSADGFAHTGIANGTTIYYSVFAHDPVMNYSAIARGVAVPCPVTRRAISLNTFDYLMEGWNTAVWKSGPYDLGTIGQNGAAGSSGGGVRCIGAGTTDNSDRCNREGGEIWKAISTLGCRNILVSYDVRVSDLGNANTGVGSGSCAVDHDLIDEQLTVLYSTDGGTNWHDAEWTTRADLLGGHQSYTRRLVDLSGISGVDGNANFALKFRWQFNSIADIGDLDNISVIAEVIDNVPPTAVVSAPSTLVTRTGPVSFGVTFSEAVTGFTPAGVTVNRGGTVQVGLVSVEGSGSLYTVTLSSITGSGTVGMRVKAGGATDAAGNPCPQSSDSTTSRVLSSDGSIATAKTQVDNYPVSLGNKVLYLKRGSFGYIQEKGRFAGIRIEGSIPASEDDLICLTGYMKTNTISGERYIQIASLGSSGPYVMGPLGSSNRAVKSHLMDGLYLKLWGVVKIGSIIGNSFILSDGSDDVGVKIITEGIPSVMGGEFTAVDGAAGWDSGRVVHQK